VSKFTIVFLFIVLINLGFILKTILRDSDKTFFRNSELQTISKELLINPIQIN
jgi:hypothetical protein